MLKNCVAFINIILFIPPVACLSVTGKFYTTSAMQTGRSFGFKRHQISQARWVNTITMQCAKQWQISKQ